MLWNIQLVIKIFSQFKNVHMFHGTQCLTAVFLTGCGFSLFLARTTQFIPFHPIYFKIHFNIIYPSTPSLPTGPVPSDFQPKALYVFFISHVHYITYVLYLFITCLSIHN